MKQMRNNKTSKIILISLLIGILLSFSACQPSEQSEQDLNKIQVVVSILPQAYFVERIGGDQVAIQVMVSPGEEAHTYEPTPEQMKALSTADLFFTIGIEYEDTWIPRFKDINPELTFVDSTKGITRIPLTNAHDHEDQSHDLETGDQTDEGGLDPHVWLSPQNGKLIAQNILTALKKLSPQNTQTFENNYAALITDIDQLDADISASLSGVERRTFMVFHPAWGYFADQYHLEQVAVQVGGQDPSPSELANLVEIARNEAVRVIFVQPTFSSANAEAIAKEIDAEIAFVDPLARDWLQNLQAVATALAAALQ